MFGGDAHDGEDLLTRARPEHQPWCTAEAPKVVPLRGQRGGVGVHRVRAGERGGELSDNVVISAASLRAASSGSTSPVSP